VIIDLAKQGTAFAVITLTIFAIGLAVERVAPAEKQQPTEGIRAIFSSFARSAILAGIPVLGVGSLVGSLIVLPSEGWAVVLSIIIYIVIADFAEYLFHRAQHAWPVLWALHSLHHSDHSVNVTTTTRHHWVDALIRVLAIYPIIGVLFAVPYQAVLVYGVIGHYHYILHFNMRMSFGPLWAILNSPQYHRLHHSDLARNHNKNFAGLFPIFDLLFGTYCRPTVGEYPTTGIEGWRGPNRICQAIVWPLANPSSVVAKINHTFDGNCT
jgi:sterol desaturase/sphingolipid hydroxylase (fatty acid hydroxylase superfamily)